MRHEIVYSPIAIRDLDRVYAEVFEASKSVETALQYIDDLMERVARKREYPKSGAPLNYDGGFTGYYFVVFKAYMAFYRADVGKIFVDRVLFGRSDYMRTLFRE